VSPSAPPHLTPLEPAADTPPPGTPMPGHYAHCFACGDAEGGLQMNLTIGEGVTVTSEFTIEDRHQGAPGLAHGGVIAAAFDEALGALQVFLGEPAVTASLQTEFRRPVPTGSVLHLECRVDGREGRKLWVSGDAHLGAPDGPIVAQGKGLFVVVTPEHFSTHGRPAEVEAARGGTWFGRPVNP
jgi:acyl-coenzyme A thioesterase PaaI-like protein